MLEVKGLEFGFDKMTILSSLNLKIKQGEITVLTGQNGSGKSSLAKILMGIYRQKKGEIYFKGKEISDLKIEERAEMGMAYAFQQTPILRGISVYKLLCLAAKKELGLFEAEKILRKVGLEPINYLKRVLDKSLSGGEMKRIEMASILVAKKDFLIFDEPEAGIDLWSFNSLLKIFTELKKEAKGILIISHQARILEQADRIIMIREGRMLEYDNYKRLKEEKVFF